MGRSFPPGKSFIYAAKALGLQRTYLQRLLKALRID
jgi:hypothetical protein